MRVIHRSLQKQQRRTGTVYPLNPSLTYGTYGPGVTDRVIGRDEYHNGLEGFWLGTLVANWTGLVTEMDKIGNAGDLLRMEETAQMGGAEVTESVELVESAEVTESVEEVEEVEEAEGANGLNGTNGSNGTDDVMNTGAFYTREDWGGPDQPSIWGEGQPSVLSPVIDFVYAEADSVWGADDDTDIEYMYQELLLRNGTSVLTGDQIREGWLRHIRQEEENYLWVSNQRALDLMREGVVPPATGDPRLNAEVEMIDAQLTTEIFGLFAPGRPDVALRMADLPVRTVARGESAWISEFYVVMFSLAGGLGGMDGVGGASVGAGNGFGIDSDGWGDLGSGAHANNGMDADNGMDANNGTDADSGADAGGDSINPTTSTLKERLFWMAEEASARLPEGSYPSKMYGFVKSLYESGISWEAARDSVYVRYQVESQDGYDMTERRLYCNGCFAAGINFAASLVSLFYGEGDLLETIRIGTLAGWDSDNPTATWGGLIGFMLGRDGVEEAFERVLPGVEFSDRFDIHRTRVGFDGDGVDTFDRMALKGLWVVDRVVLEEMGGGVDDVDGVWFVPAGVWFGPASE